MATLGSEPRGNWKNVEGEMRAIRHVEVDDKSTAHAASPHVNVVKSLHLRPILLWVSL